MEYSILFPNGQVVGAGTAGAAIRTLTVTGAAFAGNEPDPGGVCAAELAAELFDDGLTVTAGDELKLYQGGKLVGTFYAEQPTTPGPGRRKLLAYDAVSRLDKDLTDDLAALRDWPCSLSEFAQRVCAACGLTLTGDLLNADYPVARFQARGITGRQLMQWVCQAGCRFLQALPDGTLALKWVEHSGITLSATGQNFYFSGMEHGDYATAPIDGVVIALTDADVGVAAGAAQNPLRIQGNYLLAGCDETVAKTLAGALAELSVTPCTLQTTTALAPGQLFTVSTEQGEFTALAMTVENTLGRCRVTCTGSPSRTGSSALCKSDVRSLGGRVLEMRLDLQGVHSRMAEFSEQAAKVSSLTQDVDAITARVGVLETGTDSLGKDLTELENTAAQQFAQLSLRSDGLEVTVGALSSQLDQKADAQTLQNLTERFLFAADGLTITNTATGMGIHISEQQVAFSEGTVMTPNEMKTTRLHVDTRLDVGDFSYIPRTNGNLSFRYTGQ